jgi:hypothetical protein
LAVKSEEALGELSGELEIFFSLFGRKENNIFATG